VWSTARLAALGAEAVGIMQIMLDMTLDYTRIRKQFGRPLAANQVIRSSPRRDHGDAMATRPR